MRFHLQPIRAKRVRLVRIFTRTCPGYTFPIINKFVITLVIMLFNMSILKIHVIYSQITVNITSDLNVLNKF